MTVIGINIKSPPSDADLTAVRDSGATQVRIGWEPAWGLQGLTDAIRKIHSYGLSIMLCLTPHTREYTEPGFPQFNNQAARLLREGDVLEHYNAGNHKPFAKTPSAKAYAQCFHDCRAEVMKLTDPPPMILGGMSPESGILSPPTFLVDMINQGPKTEGIPTVLLADGFGIHPYCFPSDPRLADSWNPVTHLDKIHDIFNFCGKGNMPIHITEFGSPSALSGYHIGTADPKYPQLPYRYSPEYQAEWLIYYMQAFSNCRANLASYIWYTLNDGPKVFTNWDGHMGLRKADGTRKPVSSVFRAIAWTSR